MSQERVLERLKKILALARQGVGGEKENATTMLSKLLAKHGLTLEDLDDELQVKKMYWWKANNKAERTLFNHIVLATAGDRDTWKNKYRRGYIGVEATNAERMEIDLAFAIHRKALKAHMEKQARLALGAYVNKNELFAPDDGSEKQESKSDLSYADLSALMGMMDGMQRTHVRKAIGVAA